MQENNYCVYKHTSPSGKIYIGITSKRPEERWRNGAGYSSNKHFTNAINRYGWENFTHKILFTNLSKEEACQKEIELIAFYKSNQSEFGYNQSTGGEGGGAGCERTDEWRKHISDGLKGKKLSKESIKKRTETRAKNGWCPSAEHRKAISKKMVGRVSPMKGKIQSEESKKKTSESVKQTKIKISAAYKEYKSNGGTLTWNEFQREYTNLNN